MIYLTNRFNNDEQDFIDDVISSGVDVRVAIKEELDTYSDCSCFLPMILVNQTSSTLDTKPPLFALKVVVPKFWEIHMDYNEGTIWDKDVKRGVIHYLDKTFRTVRMVEWLDEEGRALSRDYYQENGWRYKEDILDQEGKTIFIQYYSPEDVLLMIEDTENHLFTVFENDVTRIYNEEQLWQNCLSRMNADRDVVVIGDQSIAQYLQKENTIACYLGQGILSEKEIQDWLMYVDYLYIYHYSVFQSLPYNEKVYHLSPLYPFKNTRNGHRALIVTHTQEVEKIEALVEQLPMLEFHIAAITAMGGRLTNLSEKENVFLYPGIIESQYRALLETCTIYFDINHNIEILNSVEESLENGLLLFGFEETCHRKDFICSEHLYLSDDISCMIEDLKKIIFSEVEYDLAIQRQLQFIHASSKDYYQKVFQREGI